MDGVEPMQPQPVAGPKLIISRNWMGLSQESSCSNASCSEASGALPLRLQTDHVPEGVLRNEQLPNPKTYLRTTSTDSGIQVSKERHDRHEETDLTALTMVTLSVSSTGASPRGIGTDNSSNGTPTGGVRNQESLTHARLTPAQRYAVPMMIASIIAVPFCQGFALLAFWYSAKAYYAHKLGKANKANQFYLDALKIMFIGLIWLGTFLVSVALLVVLSKLKNN